MFNFRYRALSKVNVKKPAEAGLSGGEADQWN